MAKTKVSEWSSTAANNTDINSIDIAEGCAPSGINNAIREMMAQVKDMQAGTDADNFTVGGNLSVTGTTTATGAITANGGVTGNLTGNVTGDVTGNVTGNVSGTSANVTGTVAVANGGTGLTTLTANNVILGNGTSAPSFVAPSTSGNVLTSNGTTWESAQLNTLVSGTAQASTSGTSINFTGIPSWAKHITVMFNGVSTNGTSPIQVRLGDSGGIESTGYTNAISEFLAGISTTNNITSAISVENATGNLSASSVRKGTLNLYNFSGNEWIYTSLLGSGSNGLNFLVTGGKSLSDTLTQLRITTLNGTDTFDAGSINIMYE